MTRAVEPITADQALEAGASMVARLVEGLVKSPEWREGVMRDLVHGLSMARDANAAEIEIMRRVAELLGGGMF